MSGLRGKMCSALLTWLAAMVLVTSSASAGVYESWGSKTELQFRWYTGAETLTDFPVVVKLTPGRTQNYAHFAAQGADLRFATADEQSGLPYEIERWDSTGDSFIWVKVPAIAHNTDFIWMYWNNPPATDAQDPVAVWPASAGYVGVWHLNRGSATGSYIDSAHPAGKSATVYGDPKPISGPVGGALRFDGIDDFVDSNNNQHLPAWTVATWVRSPEPPGNRTASGPVHRERNYEMNWSHNSFPDLRSGVGFRSAGGRTWYPADFDFDEPLRANTWYYLVGTYDGSSLLAAYRNGMLTAQNLAAHGTPDNGSYTMKIARHAEVAANHFTGDVDEVQILSVAKSATWVATQYKSMTDTLIAYRAAERATSTQPAAAPARSSSGPSTTSGRPPWPHSFVKMSVTRLIRLFEANRQP